MAKKPDFRQNFGSLISLVLGRDQVQKSNHRCNLVKIFCRYQGKIEKTHIEGQKKYSSFFVFSKNFGEKFFFPKILKILL